MRMNPRTVEDLRHQLRAAHEDTAECLPPDLHAARALVVEKSGTTSDGSMRPHRLVATAWVASAAAAILVIALIVPGAVNHTPVSAPPADLGGGSPVILELTGHGGLQDVSGSTGKVLYVFPYSLQSHFSVMSVTGSGDVAYLGSQLPEDNNFAPPAQSSPIERVPLDGSPPSVVVHDGYSPAVSPDGTELAYTTSKRPLDVFVLNLKSGDTRSFTLRKMPQSLLGVSKWALVSGISWGSGSQLLVTVVRQGVSNIIPPTPSLGLTDGVFKLVISLNLPAPIGKPLTNYVAPFLRRTEDWSGAPAVIPTSQGFVAEQVSPRPAELGRNHLKDLGAGEAIWFVRVTATGILGTLDFQPSLSKSPNTGFVFTGLSLDDSGHAYVIGGWSCTTCRVSSTSQGSILGLYRLNHLTSVPQLLNPGPVAAIAWLPNT